MKRLMISATQFFEQLPDHLRSHRWWILLAFIAATAAMFVGAGKARFDNSIEGWFEPDDPTIVAFDWLHHDFGSDDHLYMVYRPADGDVFSPESLQRLHRLHHELEARMQAGIQNETPGWRHVVKITSLINAPVLVGEGSSLISRRLVGDRLPGTVESAEELRRLALSQKSFSQLYFSADYTLGGMMIETHFGAVPLQAQELKTDVDFGDLDFASEFEEAHVVESSGVFATQRGERPRFQPTDMEDYLALLQAVRTVLELPEFAAHFSFHAVGSTAASEYNLAMISEMGMLNLLGLVIMMVLLWLLFRSFSAVLWSISLVVLSSVWMVGILGWIGLPLTFFVMIAIMLVLAVGLVDVVHVMSAYLQARRQGDEHRAAMRSAFRHVAVACTLTTLTNIVAMLALSITPVVPIQVFSVMCVLGVLLPLVFTLLLLPVLMDLWSPRPPTAGGLHLLPAGFDPVGLLQRPLAAVLPWVEARPRLIIAGFATVFVAALIGTTQTRIDTDPVASFPEDSKIRRSVALVDAEMMGAQSMEIYLDFGRVDALQDPEVLTAIEALQLRLEQGYPEVVVRTTSLVDMVKHSYMALHEDREDMYRLPETEAAISQTLFLFNQSNPVDRRKLVSDNYDRARISVRMYNKGSYEYARTWESMRTDINATVQQLKGSYPSTSVAITGMLALIMQGSDVLSTSQVKVFALALGLVSLALVFVSGSLKAGLVALVPNLIPAILAYGMLGLLGRPLDITTMMIAPIIIGVAVNDTVHFITRYRIEMLSNPDIRHCLRTTIGEVGQAVVFTSLILALGFGVLGLSDNSGVANLGIFGALAILVALLNDLLLLPALILLFGIRFESRTILASAATEHATATA